MRSDCRYLKYLKKLLFPVHPRTMNSAVQQWKKQVCVNCWEFNWVQSPIVHAFIRFLFLIGKWSPYVPSFLFINIYVNLAFYYFVICHCEILLQYSFYGPYIDNNKTFRWIGRYECINLSCLNVNFCTSTF